MHRMAFLFVKRWGFYENTCFFRDTIIWLWNIQSMLLLSDAADGPFRQIFMEATPSQGGRETLLSELASRRHSRYNDE